MAVVGNVDMTYDRAQPIPLPTGQRLSVNGVVGAREVFNDNPEIDGIVFTGGIVTTHGTIGNADSLYSDSGALINRISDRLYVGAGVADTGGNSTNSPSNWLAQLSALAYTGQFSQMEVFSTTGTLAFTAAARSSDYALFQPTGHTGAAIGVSAYGINDDNTVGGGVAGPDVWALYAEARRNLGVDGLTQVAELNIVNLGSTVDINPTAGIGANAGATGGLSIAAGGSLISNPVSVGLMFGNNGAVFRKGIVVLGNALDATVGLGGGGVVMDMPFGTTLQWADVAGVAQESLWADAAGLHFVGATASAGLNVQIGGGLAFLTANIGAGAYPASGTTSLAITDHFGAARDVDFWNCDTAATVSFAWYQKTGASAATKLGEFSPTGLFTFSGAGAASANGTVATVLGSLGPTGSHTTVQEWLTIKIGANTRYIPCF